MAEEVCIAAEKVGITGKQVWQFLKENCIYSIKILSGFIQNSGKGDPDKFWEKNAYDIIRAFGTLGVVVLLGLVVLSPLLHAILPKIGISGKEIVRNTYYLLIFIGAGLAASIATWRGRQFERQLQQSRFEKALDMAADLENRTRRASGFRILMQMLSSWGENFDDTTANNASVLHYICLINFQLTKGNQQEAFKELYTKSKNSYNPKDVVNLYEMTQDPPINLATLGLWQEIMNWRRKKFPTPDTSDDNLTARGIYSSKARVDEPTFLIFSGINLSGLKFFVALNDGKICPPTEGMRVNFRDSCFLLVEMHKASVDHVDFSNSYLLKINCREEGQIDYKMSCIGAIFNNASVIGCNFEGANLEGASFDDTNITGSDFRFAKNLTPKQFQKGAYWLRMPDTTLFGVAKPQFPASFPSDFADKLLEKPSTLEEISEWERRAKLAP